LEPPLLIPELKVLNFTKSLDFYTMLAGFDVVYDRQEEDFAMLGMNGARLMIEGITGKNRTWAEGNLEPPLGRGMHLQIRVASIEMLYNKFRDAGYPIFVDMEENGTV